MKRLTVLCLSLLLALSLCACGGDAPAEETTDPATNSAATETQPETAPEAETTPETKPDGKTEGKYACTAIAFGEDVLDGGDNWLELKSGGKATLFMEDNKYKGTYTLTDGSLSVAFPDLGDGSGTLADGVITLELLGMVCTFEK
ncbi:MAG: hypothetical protein IJO69_04520 [Ruminiclostridium sp.]|nr:hypothetical protein [Ruminiclostridium sp.]